MGRKDTITKKYLSRPEVFADAFNYLMFEGKKVIRPGDLEEQDPTEAAVIKKAGKSKTSMTLKKLKSKKKYWVRIRTYKIKGGIKYVSRWSRARAVRVK